MSIIQNGSTTTPYALTSAYGNSMVGSTPTVNTTASTTPTVQTTASTTQYPSPKVAATSSTTLIYGGASAMVKTVISSSTPTVKTTASTTPSASTTRYTQNASTTPSASSTPTVKTTASSTPAVKTTASTTPSASTAQYKQNASTTPSASTTQYKQNASTTPSASNTIYPYISHLGGEAQKQIEKMLFEMGFDDNVDGNYGEALAKFNNAYKVDSYIYSEKVANKIKEAYYVQVALIDLGFYNEKGDVEVESNSTYANSVSCNLSDAIKNFCSLYGTTNKDGKFIEKLNEIHKYYKDVLESDNLKETFQELGIDNKKQMINFSKSWTFLKKGMKFSTDLAAAVMANWYGEGGFSETNLEDTNDNHKLDDSKDYTYNINDKKGWGIMQWTYYTRKNDLLEMATEMNAGVGNINVQFALFRKEISDKGTCYSEWTTQVMSATGVAGYAEAFFRKIENPLVQSAEVIQKRVDNANIIRRGMEGNIR